MTIALILLNVLVYASYSWNNYFLYIDRDALVLYGFSPAKLSKVSGLASILTSMFIHGDIFHILFNMFVLYYFGRELEDLLGGFRYLLLYLLSGVAAAIYYSVTLAITYGSLDINAIGASGAISGLLGGFFIVYPRRTLSICIFTPIPICGVFSASVFFLIWISINLVYGLLFGGNIAFFAHIGGFIGGVALIYLIGADLIKSIHIMREERRGLGRLAKILFILLVFLVLIIIIYSSPLSILLALETNILPQILIMILVSIMLSLYSMYIALLKDKDLDLS